MENGPCLDDLPIQLVMFHGFCMLSRPGNLVETVIELQLLR